jgi:putative flavoprotein involved in K+ transport
MHMQKNKKHWNSIIIGGGQAGLATGYHLKQLNEDFLILDAFEKTGDSWRKRWDSLLLNTPAQFDGLPGYPFPGKKGSLPTKNQMADYLEAYAKKFQLPVVTGIKVVRLSAIEPGYKITTLEGIFTCDQVVVATGTYQLPHIPSFAKELDPNIFQLHSSDYRNPLRLPTGDVMVVGAGSSGVQIAIKLSKTRRTLLAGKPTFHVPDFAFRLGNFYWWFLNNIITIKTPLGRKAKAAILKGAGAPLINVSVKDIDAAGIERLPRLAGVSNGQPKLEDGTVMPASIIIWATGLKPDYLWIDMKILNETGWPDTHRGISSAYKGLYFAGSKFQFGLTSNLIGGVGRDAAFIAKFIKKNSLSKNRLTVINKQYHVHT